MTPGIECCRSSAVISAFDVADVWCSVTDGHWRLQLRLLFSHLGAPQSSSNSSAPLWEILLPFMWSCNPSYSCSKFSAELIACSLSGILNSSVTHYFSFFLNLNPFVYLLRNVLCSSNMWACNFALSVVVVYCYFSLKLLPRCSVHALLLIFAHMKTNINCK